MRLSESLHGHVDLLRLSGEIDLHYSPVFRSVLQAKAHARCPALLLDCTDVTFIDSSGMAALVEYGRDSRRFGGRFGIIGLSDRLRAVFQTVHLDEYLPLFRDCAEAKAAWETAAPSHLATTSARHEGAAYSFGTKSSTNTSSSTSFSMAPKA